MKRHTQLTGIRNWYGDDLIDLQAESLKVLDGFFTQYGSFIVSGCQAAPNGANYDVSPGIVALQGKGPQGEEVRVVAPFEGAQGVALPLYLTLRCETLSDTYVDGNLQPVAYAYKAVGSGVKPGLSHFEIPSATGGARLTDAMQDSLHRFITDAERALWNSKESPAGAQAKADAALAGAKTYADGKAATALNDAKAYADTKDSATLASAKTYADGKAATALADAKTYADTKETPAGAQTKANTALASAKTYADTKASTAVASSSAAGLMSAADKAKLDGVAASANNYAHPNDANTRHVTDTEKATWNAKASTTAATSSAAGLMSAADKAKLDGVAASANNYAHPNDANTRHVTDTEKATWNAKASTAVASTTANGLMSAADKTKLNGVATGANNYVHPNDANTRHVTDAEKATWNAKASTATATQSANGLMSAVDKTKLDGTMKYDYVVDNYEKLAGLNDTPTSVTSVLIRKGEWTYNSSNGKGIALSSSITTIVGEAGSVLIFRGVTQGACLGYPNPVTQPPILGCTYSISNVTIRNESAAGTSCFEWMDNLYNCFACFNTQRNVIGFQSCENLYSCGIENLGSGNYGTGFIGCTSLFNCYAKIAGVFGGPSSLKTGFESCSDLYHCSANTRGSMKSFLRCQGMTDCFAGDEIESCNGVLRCKAYKYTLSYASSYNDSSAYLCADTPAGGWNV